MLAPGVVEYNLMKSTLEWSL